MELAQLGTYGGGSMRSMAELALLTAMVLAGSGCGTGSNSTPSPSQPAPQPSVSVVVTPASANVYQGMTMQFQAQVLGQSNQAVTWSVEQNGLGTIDSTGLYTAPRGASGGPFHVVATSKAVPSAQGSAAVTVLVPQVVIDPATVALIPGGTQTFTATVKGLTDTAVTWTVREAAGGSINGAGFYSAPITVGFYHVVATSVENGTISGSSTITVTTSSGRFTPTGSMQNARGSHSATLLTNGKVLVAGGATRAGPICLTGMSLAELYDPLAGSFATSGSMAAPRAAHTATLLLNGEVFVTGGFGSGVDCEDLGTPVLSSAELYDPFTGTFKGTGSMAVSRAWHTATLLQDGRVLVIGGRNADGGLPPAGQSFKSAELYNPATTTFTSTGSPARPLSQHTATLLPNGKVLIAGGVDATDPNMTVATATAEIYDPATGVFSPTGSMIAARVGHTATLLANGRVLITGGSGLSTAEVYDPATGSFSATGNMGLARASHTATLLPNGTVLVAGGGDSTAELYDPATGVFSPTGGMEGGRAGHSATLLQNGKVLVAGGNSRPPLATAELYK
jgi:galactose oxidase-like protein/Big-like domain-containing protein